MFSRRGLAISSSCVSIELENPKGSELVHEPFKLLCFGFLAAGGGGGGGRVAFSPVAGFIKTAMGGAAAAPMSPAGADAELGKLPNA